eukprot:CAMPEP_0194150640 /NCGR_PEP_ID=MMETSP0152-20130528/44431_1 /TAXON_ID=1049557 /ORGANISM="Thalassiothrix antarctica, Strain L6-D1" /LENGTH=44 /DNA_ID= /DNA_START= /DNA_END= /DNA_ORIENTATION=
MVDLTRLVGSGILKNNFVSLNTLGNTFRLDVLYGRKLLNHFGLH